MKFTLKEQFNFSTNEEIHVEDCSLAIQAANDYFGFCVYDANSKNLLLLKRYAVQNISTAILDEILNNYPLLQNHFEKIITGLDFGFNTLLPSEMSSGDATPLMYLENSDQQDHVISEVIEDKQITNLYAVPPEILTWLVHNFPSSGYLHAHSVQIKSATGFSENGLLRVDFLENRFTVTAFKNEKLLLAQAYNYSSPADVAFYLLKIGEAFNFSQEHVVVQISGLIDINSKLYRSLYDYFLNLSFKQCSWTDNITNLPAHYFTSLNELTTCELLLEA